MPQQTTEADFWLQPHCSFGERKREIESEREHDQKRYNTNTDTDMQSSCSGMRENAECRMEREKKFEPNPNQFEN